LVGGRQDLDGGAPLVYGQSITDGCLSFEDTVAVLDQLAGAVRERRARARR
jgi:3-deoxy-7-phosphoheptulonate synthase